MTSPLFGVGTTVVRRDVLNGRVWTAAAHRVLHDDGHKLVLVSWPGTVGYALTTWIQWLTDGNSRSRPQAVADLAAGTWELGQWVWRDTAVVTWIGLDPDLSLQAYLPVDGGPTQWKINFERPVTRTPIGIDTCDLLLDLMVDPIAGRWRWKDADEYAQARTLGLISDADDERVRAARKRAVALAESGDGPLAEDWSQWRVPDDWSLPVLPPRVLDHVAW
ncbi:DUF402 domain-containing protein [Actinoplanes sp. L3-i22]|uniref:DUF402 domain-containing protein n=1 Tax=Actinoplanes sp. L3-i22 TaxID=2836373 RepID=UPI001C78BA1E|nr:DUF402 domain-containing protein [Actinoplanes sp. L3-i22]BCY11031.1 hypothetical protein L3i22_061190 [Actinoplanes sp. L3-i22]